MNTQKIILVSFLALLTNLLGAQIFTNYTDSTSGLPDNYVNGGVAIDQNNNKWFGTAAGVAKFDDVNWTVYTTSEGLIDNYTTCIAVDANNNIWVGTDLGASKFDGATWTNFSSANGLPTDGINDIIGDTNGNVWFATYAGLSKYDGTTFTNFNTTNGISVDLLTNLAKDSQDNIWIGTLGGGISKFDGTLFTNFGASSNIIDTNITAIQVDHNDNKWVGTFFGASVFNSSDIWVNDYTILDGLYGEYVRDIEEDSQGNIWFGIFVDYLFDGGITKFDGANWVSYSVPQGLVDVQVKRLAIDQQDNVWITTGTGVSKLELVTSNEEIDNKNSFDIYPNPASQILNLLINNDLGLEGHKIEILNSFGQIMDELNILGNQTVSISLEKYSNGIYLVNYGQKTLKFIVNK